MSVFYYLQKNTKRISSTEPSTGNFFRTHEDTENFHWQLLLHTMVLKRTGTHTLHASDSFPSTILFFLQKLRKQPKEQLSQSQARTSSRLILLCYFPALSKCPLHVIPDLRDHITVRHKASIFKMMVQTSVIQIDRSTGCHAVIGNAHLGMTESWCPFIDSYAILYQVVIERSGNAVDQFLIPEFPA